ncbi:tetratricopeptide repeat protein [Streptomyces bobili]|uniref:HTH cro/C1-type domain-containing protein n=2 Tax=Streptomyces bobili TaxID=67280 RepID=A0ABZ1R8Y2_9ACTN|nr:tetratricopeptide repeat protein [Streptomyces bobili]
MAGEEAERKAALNELRIRLNDGLTRTRLTKTQLAAQANLSRTTVYEALKTGASAPSAETVFALARVLRLKDVELLRLQRTASGEASSVASPPQVPGKLISDWDPHDLEIHPAGFTSGKSDSGARPRVLPRYVTRAHDRVLADTVREVGEGHSRMLILVGTSSTGKTRACWEAVQPLASSEWLLWHPFDPTRVEAALSDLECVRPHTVVWLNEAHHYLGDPRAGEQVAAALHSLLMHPDRQPTLILGTLWPEYADLYTALPTPGEADRHSRVRELLAGRTVTIPDTFDHRALRTAFALADQGDLLLADTLTRTGEDGRVTQDLAGAPALLSRYELASPAARAVLEAAMDARRLGVGIRLPQAFLTEAATDYLSSKDFDELTEDWAEAAFADLARPVHGKQAPLRRTMFRPKIRRPGNATPSTELGGNTGPFFQLADYLEQHGRSHRTRLCPPLSFWAAAYEHLAQPSDLRNLASAAQNRHRLEWAYGLLQRAADAGHSEALIDLARIRQRDGDREDAEALLRRAARAGHVTALFSLGQMCEAVDDWESAEGFYQQAADNGSANALMVLVRKREAAGDQEAAEALLRDATGAGRIKAPLSLAKQRDRDREDTQVSIQQVTDARLVKPPVSLAKQRDRNRGGVQELIQHVTDAGHTSALIDLARMREAAGNRAAAETLLRQATDAGHTSALIDLARIQEKYGDLQAAETLLQRAVNAGHTSALIDLARMREAAGNRAAAETLLRQATDAGHTSALIDLARIQEKYGDLQAAETLLQRAVNAGHTRSLVILMQMREEDGDREGAEALYQLAADTGHMSALAILMQMREKSGDMAAARTLLIEAARKGHTNAMVKLARRLEKEGDMEGAETLLRQTADFGDARQFSRSGRWPYGLDPDGTPTPPWSRTTVAPANDPA